MADRIVDDRRNDHGQRQDRDQRSNDENDRSEINHGRVMSVADKGWRPSSDVMTAVGSGGIADQGQELAARPGVGAK